jgi:hypothetical protein
MWVLNLLDIHQLCNDTDQSKVDDLLDINLITQQVVR